MPAKPVCRIGPFALIAGAMSLAACAPEVKLSQPRLDLPGQFESKPVGGDMSAPIDRWWEFFADPQLTGLINDAFAYSTTARTAYFRIREARGLRDQALASRLPAGNLSGSAHTQDGALISGVDVSGSGTRVDTQSLGFSPSWELDLFGRLGAVGKEARANYTASAYDYYATRLSLAADVAAALFETRGLAVQREDAAETLRIARELYDSSSLANRRGLVSGADTARLESDYANAEAELARVETALRNAKRSLLVLTGRADAPTAGLAIEPRLNEPPVPDAAPAMLLARRPDVLAAEARLMAAVSAVKIDRLALFPRFDLLGSAGLSRTGNPVESVSGLWSFGLGLSLPILDRPRLLAQLRVSQAQGEQTVLSYEAAVQSAFRDADIALANVAADGKRLKDLARANERARYAFDAARRGYAAGLTDLTTLLQSERSWRATRSLYTSAQTQALTNVVSAYRALGGGWTPGAEAITPGQSPVALPTTDRAAM